jgi:DNA modification methylase
MKPYYEQDGITLYHGDCRDILPTFADKSFDLCLTDPPYGVGYAYDGYDDVATNFVSEILPVLSALASSVPTATCCSMRQMWGLPFARWVLCWNKPGSTRRNSVGGFSIWEPIFLYGQGWRVANDALTLPDCVNHDKGNNHPCPKPLKLFLWLASLHDSTRILDPFCGSGTTLVAAKQLGRRAVGIELSEKYCEIAVKRLAQMQLQFESANGPTSQTWTLDPPIHSGQAPH